MTVIEFRGSALDDLRGFPQAAMRDAGYQLDRDIELVRKRLKDLMKETTP